MTTTRTSHTDCTHPATKADRAKCRKARLAAAPVISEPTDRDLKFEMRAVISSYYQGDAEVEEIMANLRSVAARAGDADLQAAVASYYDGTGQVEEIMGAALRGVGVTNEAPTEAPAKECTWESCDCDEAHRTEKISHTTYIEGDVRTPVYHDGIMICRDAAIAFWTMKFNGYDHWAAKIHGGAQKTLIATARRKLKALGVDMPRY